MRSDSAEEGWTEVEFHDVPAMTAQQAAMLDMHSILNVVNLLVGEIEVLGLRLDGQADHFSRSLMVCRRFAEAVREPVLLAQTIGKASEQADVIAEELAAMIQMNPNLTEDPEIREGYAAIESVLGVFRVRTQELMLRGEQAMEWKPSTAAEIQQKLLDVFSAIHAQSRGKHHFAFEAADQPAYAYLVLMRMESGGEGMFWMPAILADVMRDLVANARKYSEPGARICLDLRQTSDELELIVSDNGRGIPPDEVKRVVEFGYRASNAANRRTYGGGFGLTKALSVAKRASGRMWIGSQLGVGTRVRMVLPRPAGARAELV
jgi:signal transduction histidine kinase